MTTEKMTKMEKDTTIKSDMERISKADPGSPQNKLRAFFAMGRRRDLTRENPLGFDAVVQESVASLRKIHPGFVPIIGGG